MNILKEYNWPGKIRQLKNVVERILVISEEKIIGEDIIKEVLKNMELKKDTGIKLDKSESTEVELELIKIIEELVSEKRSNFRDSYSIKNVDNNEMEENKKSFDSSMDIEKHLEKEEERIIVDALNKNNGSREKTAEYLGISKTTLWRKMKKFNLE
jgi:DNA-binding NtrC family response regulator